MTAVAAIDSALVPLIVYYNGTFINLQNGAHARMYNQLCWAVENFPKVTLYSFKNHPDCPWGDAEIARFRAAFPEVELVLEERNARLNWATKIKNACLALTPHLAKRIISWRVKGATPRYEALLAKGPCTLLIHYVDAVSQLNGVDPGSYIIETHDLKFLHYAKKCALPLCDIRVMGKLRSELWALSAAGGLIAIAPPENAMFRLFFPDVPVFYVPSYPAASRARHNGEGAVAYDLLFVASENHFNVGGFSNFVRINAHWLARYRIALAGRIGAVTQIQILAARFSNITLLGYVEDIGDIYAQARAVISPVEGTGLKIKVVEALKHAKPVLASEHSKNGLPPGSEGCVFPLTEENVAKLCGDDALYQGACRAALAYAAGLDGLGEADKLRDFLFKRLESRTSTILLPDPDARIAGP